MGVAYGFFNCRAPKERIEERFPCIRRGAEIPPALDLLLVDGVQNLKSDDPQLRDLVSDAHAAGRQYVLEARYPQATNKQAADETVMVLNHLYLQPTLFDKDEPFYGEIVYEENGTYIFHK
jgi:hypothetical protein